MSGKIVIAGEVDLPPESRDAALLGAKSWIEAARAERGCRHYAWTAAPYDPKRLHVFEEWDCAADLAAHLRGPAYFGMLGHLSSFRILGADTRKYRVDRIEPVYGADGVASAEFGSGG